MRQKDKFTVKNWTKKTNTSLEINSQHKYLPEFKMQKLKVDHVTLITNKFSMINNKD